MKISSIQYNFRQENPVSGELAGEYVFLYTKSPAVFRLGNAEQNCPENSVIVFRSGTLMNYRSASDEPLLCDCISFRTSTSDQQFIASLGIPMNTSVSISEGSVVQNLIRCLYTGFNRSGKRKAEFSDYALKLIFIGISEDMCDTSSRRLVNIPHYRKLESLREKIYALPASRWNIDDICADLKISKTYFHRIYFAAFGVTCMQDVINSRLTCAGDLLINTGLSVSSIAEKCGYDSDSYFMRQFKRNIGYTPSEYRRLYSRTIQSSFRNAESDSDDYI